MILHLGVIDLPYTSYDGGKKAANPKRRGKKLAPTRKRGGKTVTTFQVATWLEDRYHVMEVFYESGGVLDLLTESVASAMENLLMGAPVSENPFLEGASEIQSKFKLWLSHGSIEKMGIPGVPTQAAINRKTSASARFKSLGKKKGRPSFSPSFIDTGLYQSSFQAWVE